MAKATAPGGKLNPLKDCLISIPGAGEIQLNNLPDISESKSAEYNDEPVMGRSTPMKTYSHSGNRSINMTLHFYVVSKEDAANNLADLRKLESLVYPRTGKSGMPFQPPPVCSIKCGKLLGDEPLCVVLRNYSVKFPTDVAWDTETYTPFKFDVDTQWDVVYQTQNLPGQEKIMGL